eukprot:9491126-Pyramimonas_sp.AAC.1
MARLGASVSSLGAFASMRDAVKKLEAKRQEIGSALGPSHHVPSFSFVFHRRRLFAVDACQGAVFQSSRGDLRS